mgnify:CR=1
MTTKRQSVSAPESKAKGGRPLLDPHDATVAVCAKLPPVLHDAACQQASRQGQSVTAVIRDALRHFVLHPTAYEP